MFLSSWLTNSKFAVTLALIYIGFLYQILALSRQLQVQKNLPCPNVNSLHAHACSPTHNRACTLPAKHPHAGSYSHACKIKDRHGSPAGNTCVAFTFHMRCTVHAYKHLLLKLCTRVHVDHCRCHPQSLAILKLLLHQLGFEIKSRHGEISRKYGTYIFHL